MTQLQYELLSLINERTEWEGHDASRPLVHYWVPPTGDKSCRCEALDKSIYIDGAGVAAALRALVRRGWTKPQPAAPYACSITEEGILALEQHRSAINYYAEKQARDEAKRRGTIEPGRAEVLIRVFGPSYNALPPAQQVALERDVEESGYSGTIAAFEERAWNICRLIGGLVNLGSYCRTIVHNYPDLHEVKKR